MMAEVELFIQWVSAGYTCDPISTVLVSKSTFDLVSLRKLSPRMRGCANNDTTITGVGHTFRSKNMSTWTVPSEVNVPPVDLKRL